LLGGRGAKKIRIISGGKINHLSTLLVNRRLRIWSVEGKEVSRRHGGGGRHGILLKLSMLLLKISFVVNGKLGGRMRVEDH